MEFRLDEAQVDLQQTVARFCATRYPLDSVLTREGVALDRDGWLEMAELGILGLLATEDSGGSGLGLVEGALVFEQLGSHLVPGPVLWTVLAAGLVDGAAGGEIVVGGLEAGSLDGAAATVEHATDLDVLLVLGDADVRLHRGDALPSPDALDPLDPLTPVGRFAAIGDGEPIGGPDVAARLRIGGTVLAAALLSGVASRALEVARAYALERHQFDAPIGSFQAVKHMLADMYVRGSLAQSATYAAAAVAQDPGSDDPWQAAAAAKLLAADAAIANAGTAVQVLGGMGFTWDMLPNHLLKRAWVLEQAFGRGDDHALDRGRSLVSAAS